MNGQNEKLKELIAELKAEETHLLEAIKENIEMESETEKEDNAEDGPQIKIVEEPKRESTI